MMMFVLFIFLLINIVHSSHFNGGTIAWTPVYPDSNSSSILITVTQSYSWVYPTETCTTNIPQSTGGGVNLICIANCSTQGGYVNQTISIRTDCTSFSTSLGIVFSERSVNITLNDSTYFWIAYRGAAWRALENTLTNNTPGWSIASLIDLRRRPDGLINTPPISQVASPQYVLVNTTTTINLLVSDANTGDDLRCRWPLQNNTSGIDECSAVCPSASLKNISVLSNCTIYFTATKPGVWYAISVQVEDFISTTSTIAMTSVPIQFLIYVLPPPTCSILPLVIPLTGCLEVQVNTSVNYTLYVMNYCNRTRTIVTDLITTVSINGMKASNLTNSTTNTSLVLVTLTWTPQPNQIGSHQFCAVAYNNEKVQSTPYCVTFTVTTSIACMTTTVSTTTTTSTTTSTETTSTITTHTTTTSQTTTTSSETSTSTTTDTSTSTMSETTATSTTSVITTTTSKTTETTQTTTSVTTTTQTTITTTTTKLSNLDRTNIPLIVGLSMMFLLMSMCGACLWLWCVKWGALSRRRLKKDGKNLQHEMDIIPTAGDTKKDNKIGKRSKGYNVERGSYRGKTVGNRHSNDRIRSILTSVIQRKRISDINNSTVTSAGQPFMKANTSSQSCQQEKIFDTKTYPANQRLQLRHSSVTVNSVKLSTSSLVDINRDDLSQKSDTLQCVPKKIPPLSPGVHVVKVSKTRMSLPPKPLGSIPSEPIDPAAQSQDPSNNISNHFNSTDSISNQTSSVHTPRIIVADPQSSSARSISHKHRSKRKHKHSDGRQRSFSLNQS